MLRKIDFRPWIAHGYFILTIVGLLLFFSPSPVFYNFEFILMLGCHTAVTPFFGMLLAAEAGSRFLVFAFLGFWILFGISFLICYLIAAFRKRYIPLAVIAFVDALFSILILCWAIIFAGFSGTDIRLLIGIVFSALIFASLLCFDRLEGIRTETT